MVDFTEETGRFADRIKGLSIESEKDSKHNEQPTDNDIADLEELDRQNAQFDQTDDTDEIAIVARLAADGAER